MTKRTERKPVAGGPSGPKATARGGAARSVDGGADAATAALAPLRERIDAIDREIVALLNERAQIGLEIGRVKDASGGRAIRDPRREAEVIERVTSISAGLFPEPELVALYRRLIAANRQVQAEQRRRAKLAEGEPRG
jgi:chorismate mutase